MAEEFVDEQERDREREEEGRLVARAQAGDRLALRAVFERHADSLYRAILWRLRDAALAEDVLRDTLLTALEKIGAFRWQGNGIHGWLRQIAVNRAIDLQRRARRTVGVLARVAGESPQETPVGDGAEAQLIAAEDRRSVGARIAAALADLHPRYREAITLRLIDDQPREECARRLGVTLGTFDVVLFRAVRAFRRSFGDGGTRSSRGL